MPALEDNRTGLVFGYQYEFNFKQWGIMAESEHTIRDRTLFTNEVEGDLRITWDTYNKSIEDLAVQIFESGYDFNQIVCIAKGGLRVGDILARIFDVPFAVMSVESYHGDDVKDKQGQIVFGNSLAKTSPNLGNRVLLVDDLADSGVTLEKCVRWLEHYEGFFIDELRTATVWTKGLSTFTPDYYIEYLPNNPWIHQPMSVEELREQ